MIQGNKIRLRALEKRDYENFYRWENASVIAGDSSMIQPVSAYIVEAFIENAGRAVEETGQLRLLIETIDGQSLGLVDVFDVDFRHRRAGLGIVIGEVENRNNGYASEAIQLICTYAFRVMNLEVLYADIRSENMASLRVFDKAGFHSPALFPNWDSEGGIRKSAVRVFCFREIKV